MSHRYLVCVLGGTKNPFRGEVGEDISNAILKCKAHDGIPARYWNKEEQEERLIRAYDKWVARGGVWTAAAEKVCLSLAFLLLLSSPIIGELIEGLGIGLLALCVYEACMRVVEASLPYTELRVSQ